MGTDFHIRHCYKSSSKGVMYFLSFKSVHFMHSGQLHILACFADLFLHFVAFKPRVFVHLLFLLCDCCFDGGRWCPLVKPTLFWIQSGSDLDYCRLETGSEWNLSCLNILCKLTVCACVHILLYVSNVFKELTTKCFEVFPALNIQLFCTVQRAWSTFF